MLCLQRFVSNVYRDAISHDRGFSVVACGLVGVAAAAVVSSLQQVGLAEGTPRMVSPV